jgi:hypothetical protein
LFSLFHSYSFSHPTFFRLSASFSLFPYLPPFFCFSLSIPFNISSFLSFLFRYFSHPLSLYLSPLFFSSSPSSCFIFCLYFPFLLPYIISFFRYILFRSLYLFLFVVHLWLPLLANSVTDRYTVTSTRIEPSIYVCVLILAPANLNKISLKHYLCSCYSYTLTANWSRGLLQNDAIHNKVLTLQQGTV